MINNDDLPDDLATRVLSTSTHLAAAVAFADEVRAVLHQRDEASDTELVERIDTAFDRYWSATRESPHPGSGPAGTAAVSDFVRRVARILDARHGYPTRNAQQLLDQLDELVDDHLIARGMTVPAGPPTAQDHTAAMWVTCRRCQAEVGGYCVNPGGQPSLLPHPERVDAARRRRQVLR